MQPAATAALGPMIRGSPDDHRRGRDLHRKRAPPVRCSGYPPIGDVATSIAVRRAVPWVAHSTARPSRLVIEAAITDGHNAAVCMARCIRIDHA